MKALKEIQMRNIRTALQGSPILTLIQDEYFKPRRPYPNRKEIFREEKCECCGSILPVDPKKSEAEYKRMMTEYRADTAHQNNLFKYACFFDLGIKWGTEASDRVFELAWSRGHSAGLHEVYGELMELSSILAAVKEY